MTVDVWRAWLGGSPAELRRWWRMLSDAERERAERFRFERHRERFVAGRGRLRELLGQYVCQPPERLAFEYGHFGKPFLASRAIHFNVSHADDLALYAVAAERSIGVDVERLDRRLDHAELARHFFTAREQSTLVGLTPAARTALFCRYWTCKEAYLKCTGKGVQGLRDGHDVLLPSSRRQARATLVPGGWSLSELRVPAGFRAALAVAGAPVPIVQRGWLTDPTPAGSSPWTARPARVAAARS